MRHAPAAARMQSLQHHASIASLRVTPSRQAQPHAPASSRTNAPHHHAEDAAKILACTHRPSQCTPAKLLSAGAGQASRPLLTSRQAGQPRPRHASHNATAATGRLHAGTQAAAAGGGGGGGRPRSRRPRCAASSLSLPLGSHTGTAAWRRGALPRSKQSITSRQRTHGELPPAIKIDRLILQLHPNNLQTNLSPRALGMGSIKQTTPCACSM